ncbi:hypothetical protein QZH41_005776 [Actinostola sp. cb2023]|nr:hypothetical protein QZH41_005776 [Actinostola sp. cb2023]
MEGLKPPRALSFEGHVAENWRRWIQQFRLYLNATGRDKKSEEMQCSTLLTVAGEDAVEVYNTFELNEAEQKKIELLISKFEQYCTPKKNVTFERHIFNTRNQVDSENIDTYVTELRKLAKSCEFAQLQGSLIKDHIVCGIQSSEVKERLLREEDLTLEKALTICCTAELSKIHLKNIVEGGQEQVAAIYSRPKQETSYRCSNEQRNDRNNVGTNNCSKCGAKHELRKCFTFDKTCHKCKKLNHFAKMCRSDASQSRVNALQEEDTDS